MRSKDFKNKRDYVKALKKKAADKNPDEFYFKMNSSKVEGGKHTDIVDNSLGVEEIKLLKTQDAGYIAFRKSVDDNRLEKLKKSLHFVGEKKPLNHTVFVDDADKLHSFDPAEHFDTSPELVDRSYNRIKKGALAKMVETGNIPAIGASKKQSSAYKELKLRGERSNKLGKVLSKMHLQKAVMGKGSKRKIVSTDEHGKEKVTFKWKRQRSK